MGLAAASVAGLACTRSNGGGVAEDSASFIAEVCASAAPCCAQLDKPTDGPRCAAFFEAFTQFSTYDPALGSACLRELHAARSTSDFCATLANATCWKDAFRPLGSPLGAKPGAACSNDNDCAPSTEGSVRCSATRGSGSRSNMCQIVLHGVENATPCSETRDADSSISWGSAVPGAGPTRYYCDVADGLYCNIRTFACTKLQGAGGPCPDSYAACTKDTFCESGICIPRIPLGGNCARSSNGCIATAFCAKERHPCPAQPADGYCEIVSDKCTPRRADGSPCESSAECQHNRCASRWCDATFSLAFMCTR